MSSGSQHRKKESGYSDWVPVEKVDKSVSVAVSVAAAASGAGSSAKGSEEQAKDSDSVFPETPSQVRIRFGFIQGAVAEVQRGQAPSDSANRPKCLV